MVIDYEDLRKQTSASIREAGKLIKLISLNEESADVNKPWDQGVVPAEQETLTNEHLELYGVNLPLTSAKGLGLTDMINGLSRKTKSFFLVEVDDNYDAANRKFEVLQDGTDKKGITFYEVLKPADVPILIYVGVEK